MDFTIKTMADYMAEGKSPEVLFWVGCAGSFDDRAKKITKAFAKLLNKIGVEFAVLGQEESCTGDPAKRAGNEFVSDDGINQHRNPKRIRSKKNCNSLSTLF